MIDINYMWCVVGDGRWPAVHSNKNKMAFFHATNNYCIWWKNVDQHNNMIKMK